MNRSRLLISIFLLCGVATLTACAKKQTGPEISVYSDIYRIGDQWYCPLCNQPVKNGDRSNIDPALYLSEWHDVFLDSAYFDQKINHISDAELLASLRLPGTLSAEADSLARNGRAAKAIALVKTYYAGRPDNQRLYHYDTAAKIPFIRIDEFVADVQRDPERRRAILEAARAVAHPDSGYTIGGIRFGRQVDFNYEWKDVSQFGVHYLRFLVDILNAYLITRDDFYADAFEDLFNQWYDQKDRVEHHMRPGEFKRRDVIWYELGLGARLPRLIDSYRVHRRRLSEETHRRMLKTVLGSARWLYECLSRTPFHPYNWQTQTAMTLAYTALVFPEFAEAPKWLEASRKNMVLHFQRDILDDGGYIERTGSYTNYVFGMFYRYMLLFKYFAKDSSLLETYLPRLEKLMEFTALTLTPIGVSSPFNDSRRGTDLADLLVEMGVFFRRADFLGVVDHRLSPEKRTSLPVAPRKPEVTSVNFPYSQFAVMRDGWQPESYFMIINYGPFQNHGHYDILDFEIFANGVPIAVDAGIGLKGYQDPVHVSWYKHSRSHNMLTIDDAVVNKRGIAGEDVVWAPQSWTDYFAASHRGYQEFHDTVSRRHFAFVKGEYWVVFDQVLTPRRNKTLDWNLHTPLHMRQVDNGFLSEEVPGALVTLPSDGTTAYQKKKKSGPADLRGIPGEAPNREIDWLIFRKKSEAKPERDRFQVLIYPLKQQPAGGTSQVEFQRVELEEPGAVGLRVATAGFEDLIIFSDGQPHRFTVDLSGDFTFGWFRIRDGRPYRLSLAGASQIRWGEMSRRFDEKRDFETEL